MINLTLSVDKAFKDQGTKCMKTKFGAMNQPQTSKILWKKKRVLALIMFYETRQNPKKISKCWVVSFIQL